MDSRRQREEFRRLVDALLEDKIQAAKKLLELLLVESGELPPDQAAERLVLLEKIVDSLPDGVLPSTAEAGWSCGTGPWKR